MGGARAESAGGRSTTPWRAAPGARGHRLALAVQSSSTVWAVPGNPGTVDVADGRLRPRWQGSSLVLPTL